MNMVFLRQKSFCWQRYFEERMDLRLPEYYTFHTYAFKVTSYNKFEPRFLVISNFFVYNVKMKSETSRLNRKVFSYSERLWYHPIDALTKVQLEPCKNAKSPYLLNLFFDLDLQNEILVNMKKKKQK